MPLPRLIAVDWHPLKEDGETRFVLRDVQGANEYAIVLPFPAFVVASMLDGKRDVEEVRKAVSEQFDGADFQPEEIMSVVQQLDERRFLDTEAYQKAVEDMQKTFIDAKTRPALHLESYGADGKEFETTLKGFYTGENGAGEPEKNSGGGVDGILAPHIDFHRGGYCYTHAYRRITEASDADVYVILGVAHSSPESPFVLTNKTYETPLGPVDPDSEFINTLIKKDKADWFDHEIVHRNEHSAEFQAAFLRHSVGDRKISVVPILCSTFEPHADGKSPSSAGIVEDRILQLIETVNETAKHRKVCIVGGVDFAHVGPRFNDPYPVTPQLIKWMEKEDRESIDEIEKGDAEGFWSSVMKDENKRHVCGLSATYTTLRVLSPVTGKLLRYGYAPDPAGGIVSFASVEFGRAQ